jgi:hypothetical protein
MPMYIEDMTELSTLVLHKTLHEMNDNKFWLKFE